MSRWTEAYKAGKYEYNYLVDILSDYSKEVIGSRIRMWGKPADEIIRQLDILDQLRSLGQELEIADAAQYGV